MVQACYLRDHPQMLTHWYYSYRDKVIIITCSMSPSAFWTFFSRFGSCAGLSASAGVSGLAGATGVFSPPKLQKNFYSNQTCYMSTGGGGGGGGECDWLVMSSVFDISQSSCFFHQSIKLLLRLVENRLNIALNLESVKLDRKYRRCK